MQVKHTQEVVPGHEAEVSREDRSRVRRLDQTACMYCSMLFFESESSWAMGLHGHPASEDVPEQRDTFEQYSYTVTSRRGGEDKRWLKTERSLSSTPNRVMACGV